MPASSNFTQLLTEWREGHPQALERLTPLVYDELRGLARNYMKGERGSHTLQATAVVHEAFLRLIQANVALQDRAHFFALASRLMRRVLVDHAKSRARIKRGPGIREPVTEDTMPPAPSIDVIALDEALEGLNQMEPRSGPGDRAALFRRPDLRPDRRGRWCVGRDRASRHQARARMASQ